jgi:hypothetical protein
MKKETLFNIIEAILVFLVILYIGIQLIFVEKQELDIHPEINAAINKLIDWGGLI